MSNDPPHVARLRPLSRHLCAVCEKPVDWAHINGRADRGTQITARCHGRVFVQIISDVSAEDDPNWIWALDDEGIEYVSPQKRKIREAIERARQKRAQ